MTVLRDGANAATFLTRDTDMPSLVAAIVGKGSQQAKLMSIAGLGPHGERAVPPDQLALRGDEEERARAAHYTVAVVLHTTQSDWSRQQLSGIVTTLGKYSAAVVDVVDCDFKADDQVAALDRLIQRRPDAIISIPLDSARTAEAHRRVTQAGIKLVLMDNAPTPLRAGTDYACVVSADNFGLGEVAAKMLAPHVPEGGIVGVAGYAADFFATSEREIAFRKWMKEHRPDVVLRSAKFADVDDADRAAETLLQAEPDLRGLFVVWDEPAMRVVGALRRLGRDLPVTTIDLGNDVAIELASGGLVKGVGAQQPYDQGEAEATAAILALLGRELPPWVALPAVQVSELNVLEAYQAVWHAPASPELIKARQVGRSRGAISGEPAAAAGVTRVEAGSGPLLELRDVQNDRLRGVDLSVGSVRSSGSPGWWAAGARRSWRPSSDSDGCVPDSSSSGAGP